MAEANRTQTSVYRYYDRHGILIYVGMTSRGAQRQGEHVASKDWWQFVARQEVDHFPTAAAARAHERQTIASRLPPFNTQHNPMHRQQRAAYLAAQSARALHAPVLTGPKWVDADVRVKGGAVSVTVRDAPQQMRYARPGRPTVVSGRGSRLVSVERAESDVVMHIYGGRSWQGVDRARVLLGYPDGRVVIKRIEAKKKAAA